MMKTVRGQYTQYRIQKDGSLKRIKTVKYTYQASAVSGCFLDADRAEELKMRDEQDIERQAQDCADFEELADNACEWGE